MDPHMMDPNMFIAMGMCSNLCNQPVFQPEWTYLIDIYVYTGIILCMCPASERQCYNVASSLIVWAHSQNDPCVQRTVCLMEYAHGFVVLCFVVVILWVPVNIHVIYLPIFFRVASLALGQLYDCPSACEVTLKDIGRISCCLTTSKCELCAYCMGCTVEIYVPLVGCNRFPFWNWPNYNTFP